MIQFLFITILLLYNAIIANNSDIRLEIVNEYSRGKQVAENYRNQTNNLFIWSKSWEELSELT